jgi:glycosyltransferase involved in cell wall biosynthesis
VTVHDVTFVLYPKRYSFIRRSYMQIATRLSLRTADAIIVPSESVRRDMERFPGPAHPAVHVIPEATRFRRVENAWMVAAVRQQYARGQPYILNVGSLEPGKNQMALVQAYRQLRDQGYPHQLIIAGQPAWGYQPLVDLVERLGLVECIRLPGYVPDDDLAALYSGADVFVFPSIHEGFGLPVIEAMACGAPVICSDRSALPEITDGAAILVDPGDRAALTRAIARVLDDHSLQAQLRARGLARAAAFTWERTARATLAVYESV